MTRSRQYIGTGDSGSFIVIGKILDDILQITLQKFTQRIQCVGGDGFSGFQTPDRRAADLSLDLQRIRCRS
jgi:hypothetical protein